MAAAGRQPTGDNARMTHADLPLGRAIAYPRHYDPGLLYPIARSVGRSALALDGALPFTGLDRWHAYELSWLDARGKPVTATATFTVPADSPFLIESKSLKLYLNSFNAERCDSAEMVHARIAADLSAAAGAQVAVAFGLPPVVEHTDGVLLDALEVAVDAYGPPDPSQLRIVDETPVEEVLHSHLLKSNCPVTGQPDWADLRIVWHGPRLDHAGVLRYLISFRDHAEFHEQCVERIFTDLLRHGRARALSVEARYTRRGGLDINPWRATPGLPAPAPTRSLRQ